MTFLNSSWLMFWMSIPWIGSIMTLLGNPNRVYSRRVLGWSIGCFLALSLGLWWGKPGLFMTNRILESDTTAVTLFTGMMFAGIVFLFTWPDGKTAKGLAILGGGLALMVGVRFDFAKTIYTALEPFFMPNRLNINWMSVVGVILGFIWIFSIPFLTKKNTEDFDQSPLFGKFVYFMRWSMLFLPLVVLKTFFISHDAVYNGNRVSEVGQLTIGLLVFCICWVWTVLNLQSWRIPGFWRKFWLFVSYPIFYIVNYKYIFSPLSSDKKAIKANTSPELLAFWNPEKILNRGLIQTFFNIMACGMLAAIILTLKSHIPDSLLVVEHDMAVYAIIGLALILVLHVYAIFQPNAPYRFLLCCSMLGLMLLVLALYIWYTIDYLDLVVNNFTMGGLALPAIIIIVIPSFIGIWFAVFWPLRVAYKYRAILKPEHAQPMLISPGTPPLSRFWVVSLLTMSLVTGCWALSLVLGY